MIKTAVIFTISLILTAVLFSCGGGGGGGVDEAIDETFTVSYDANGAESGAVPAAQKGSEKSPVIISDNTGNLHKNGYVFCGWRSPSSDLFNPGTSYNGKKNAQYGNDKKKLTLFAAWEPLFNYNVINPGSPAPALDEMQKSPSISYAEITGLTVRGLELSNIEIPWSMDGYQISSIHSQAFYNNANIQSISIPESVTSIGFLAFYGCSSIASITIPSSVTNIGHEAFSHCSSLSNLILLSSTPPVMGEYALAECPVTVSVPAAGVDEYKAAEGWNTYSASINGYSNETYTVTFDGQGATTAANPASIAVVPPNVTVGSLPSNPDKTGYIFGGWYKGMGGTGGEFTSSTVVSSNMTVYANWEEYSYTVEFDDQGATTPVSPTSKTVASPNTTVGSLPSEPENTGYYFGGWNTKADGTGAVFTASTPVTGNITVYAIWLTNPPFVVTFDGQGATTEANPSSRQVVSPAVTVGELPTPPLKTGYNFGGWYNQPEGTGGEFTASTVVTKNTTVYAKWNSYRYTVAFDAQEATEYHGEASKVVESPDTTVRSLPVEPVKTGYSFGGWFTEPSGGGNRFEATTIVTDNMTVYAKWTAKSYQITYKDQGNSEFSGVHGNNYPTIHTYGSDTLLINPTKNGYTFGGWYEDSDCTGLSINKLNATSYTNNITLYAKWIFGVIINNMSNGQITSDKTENLTAGERVTLTITPNSGYILQSISAKDAFDNDVRLSGSGVVSGSKRTFIMPSGNVTINATFVAVYSVSCNNISQGNSGGSKVTANKTSNIIAGETITLAVSTVSGVYLDSLTLSKGSLNENVSPKKTMTKYTFTMPESNVDVNYAFNLQSYDYISYNGAYYEDSNIGDVVLETGNTVSLQTYNNYNNEIKMIDGEAVGVVAFKDNEKEYMIGLKSGDRKWCTSGASGYHNQTTKDGYYNTYSLIQNKNDYSETTYPAFAYAIDYTTINGGDVNASTKFSSDWFIPSAAEYSKVIANKDKIIATLNAINNAGCTADSNLNMVWTSSQGSSSDCAKYYGGASVDGSFNTYDMVKTNPNYIRVIRKIK